MIEYNNNDLNNKCHTIESVIEGIDSNTLEELDHALEYRDHNISEIETAYGYFDDIKKNALNAQILNFSSATNSDEKESAILKIIDLLK